MNKEQFVILLPIIVNDLVKYISEQEGISEMKALDIVYNSKLYSLLEKEQTKV